MATLVIRSMRPAVAAVASTSGKNTSWEFSKVKSPSAPVSMSAEARSAAPSGPVIASEMSTFMVESFACWWRHLSGGIAPPSGRGGDENTGRFSSSRTGAGEDGGRGIVAQRPLLDLIEQVAEAEARVAVTLAASNRLIRRAGDPYGGSRPPSTVRSQR